MHAKTGLGRARGSAEAAWLAVATARRQSTSGALTKAGGVALFGNCCISPAAGTVRAPPVAPLYHRFAMLLVAPPTLLTRAGRHDISRYAREHRVPQAATVARPQCAERQYARRTVEIIIEFHT